MSLSFVRLIRRRGVVLLGVGGIIAAAVGVLPAQAAVLFADANFSGSAVGSAIHVDAISTGDTRIANADVAYGSSAVASKGLTAQALNENSRVISPALGAAKNAYGQGIGLTVGLAGSPSADGTIELAGKATVDAPPNVADGNQELGPIDQLDPIAYASAVKGHAHAKWNPDTCVLGSDIASGLGYVADAQLVDAGGDNNADLDSPVVATDAPEPGRNVVQTFARNTLVPNSAGAFGMQSQVRQTLAPVTIAGAVTIEVLGEWVLTATATGIPGESKIEYAPAGSVTPTTPILRIIQGSSITQLLFQDVFGATGLDQINIPGVAEIAIGEDPRAIGGDASSAATVSGDGTTVTGAVDVVRVKLLGGTLADVRIGHMEVKAAVPSGGVTCPIPTSKKATPSTVTSATAPDGKFQVAITIKNSFDCDLTGVTAEDVITRKSGTVTFNIEENDARNDPKKGAGAVFTTTNSTSAKATYGSIGTIPAGGTKVLNLVLHAAGNGEIQDTATVKGTLACPGGNAIGRAVALTGSGSLVTGVNLSKVLARTGGSDIGLFAAIPAVALLVGRRVRKAKVRKA